MANQKELDAHYTIMDKIFRMSLGEKGAYSCAKFDGDYSLTIEEAQERKHKFIVEKCNIKKGDKVLDMGCGWGAFVNYLTEMGVNAYGVVLAKGQADACIKNGLNVRHMDSKLITPETFGKFDAVTAMGSPEHLCSVEEYKAGKQEEIYKRYFKQVADLLPVGGRFFCQSMVFGPKMMPFEEIPFGKVDLHKNKNDFTDAELMEIICQKFPGSWIPYGAEGLIEPAKEHFKMIHCDSGRLDYIETIDRWSAAFAKLTLEKFLYYITLIPRYFYSPAFRHWLLLNKNDANQDLFRREIFEHYRIVFEKIKD